MSIFIAIKSLLRHFTRRSQDTTFYGVSRDGALVLDREGLLRSGKMKRQLDAARQLKAQPGHAKTRGTK